MNKHLLLAAVVALGAISYAWAQTPVVVTSDEAKPFKADYVAVMLWNPQLPPGKPAEPIYLRHTKLQRVGGNWFVVGVQTTPTEKRDKVFENPLFWTPMSNVMQVVELQSIEGPGR
jgi:hypothetical protein